MPPRLTPTVAGVRALPRPTLAPPLPAGAASTDNSLWAADVWFHIKKHWVLEAQKVLRARQALMATQALRQP